MDPRARSATLLMMAAALVPAQDALGQGPPPAGRRELVGIVRDSRGVGLEGAFVEVLGAATRTDAKGAFRLSTPDIDTATITIRLAGFGPLEALISTRNRMWDTVMVELEQLSQLLSGVKIEEDRGRQREGLLGFEERVKQKVSGVFITRDDIVKRNTARLSDVLQTRRGINLVRLAPGRYGARFATYSGSRAACIPDMWLDGQRVRGMEIDDLPANTVEGLELYDSFATVPFQFSHTANAVPCGTIVAWTRPPGTRRP